DELETDRGKMLADIKRYADDNYIRPMQLFLQGFYGDHSYGIPEVGFEKSVRDVRSADLISWKEKLFRSGRLIVAAVGNFDPHLLRDHLEKTIEAMPSGNVF